MMSTSTDLTLELGAEEERRLLESRLYAVKRFRRIAVSMLVCAVMSIIIGIVIMVEARHGKFPLLSGSPIWSGVIVLLAASFGLVLGWTNSNWTTDNDRVKQRSLLLAFYVIAVISCSLCGLSVIYTIWGAVVCGKKFSGTCGDHYKAETALNIIAALLGSFLLFVCITTSILFCYYKKSFKFYSTKDRFEQMQQLIINQQKQIETQGETFQKTQYSAIQSQYGTNFPSAPPPYAEKAENI